MTAGAGTASVLMMKSSLLALLQMIFSPWKNLLIGDAWNIVNANGFSTIHEFYVGWGSDAKPARSQKNSF